MQGRGGVKLKVFSMLKIVPCSSVVYRMHHPDVFCQCCPCIDMGGGNLTAGRSCLADASVITKLLSGSISASKMLTESFRQIKRSAVGGKLSTAPSSVMSCQVCGL